MSRLANQIAMGFFPTDNKAVEAILDSLSSKQIPSDFNVCDPCCGEGEALSRFKRFAGVTTYGVELDEERAKKAFEKLDNLICSDALFGINKSRNAFSFLFLNPPYLDIKVGGKQTRAETEFVLRWTKTLVREGIMLLIINPTSTANMKMTKILKLNGMEVIHNFYFNNADRKNYKQYFLLLKKVDKVEMREEDYHRAISPEASVPFNEVDLGDIVIPQKTKRKILFNHIGNPKIWQIEAMLQKSNMAKNFFKRVTLPKSNKVVSIMPPNEGQSSLLLGSGFFNDEISGFLIKGGFSKKEMLISKDENSTKTQEQFVSNIYAFSTIEKKYYKLQ
ncbi:hypothetical protein BA184_06855 [Helicobacter pullorum]|uniref:DUF6094 domain-containing protein n=1 Tax=Helicobacter pullorum TaxID=35818 RepID=UPI000816A986|nr:DUF6094 domain-containing protein [Helicobacter pullorum]EAI7507400.1 SAM-dependent methyltransferase [Campylobacter coli]EAK6385656.1 SAM-dependent methyltransferase [Campylobacter coli]EKM9864634.1 SAM-dependent methyltransferase [Campylobacter coli]OCR07286.1 hypothetical protein BA185_04860 [Helicobacter pullorum]OCR09325.1 hypothetical protein BA184_06855 [Helicobacter pullorum]